MSEKNYGWAGTILRVNLEDRATRTSPTAPLADRFLGGRGLGAKIAWDEIDPATKALDPVNKLIFATGPLTGTTAPGSGRLEIVGRSPNTYPNENITRSGIGASWGSELKYAGFDALILESESEKPVYIMITNDKIEFRDAADLWGQDTFVTQKILKKRHGSRTQIFCIGPAGENRCRFAAIISETCFAAGKSGFGAVMGAKKVKAICVSGPGGGLEIAHPRKLADFSARYRELLAKNPMREWGCGYKPPKARDRFLNKYRTGNAGCMGCPTQCFSFIKIPGLDPGQIHCVNYFYLQLAYDYYRDNDKAEHAFWHGFTLWNKLGICSFEMAGMIQWVRDLNAEGLLSESQAELPLDKVGSVEFIDAFLNGLAHRRGLGDLLAEGAARAAEKLPEGWRLYETYYPAHGQVQHNSVRSFPAIAMLWALDSRDPLIDHHAYRHLTVSRRNWPEPHHLSLENANAISEKIFGSKTAIDHRTYDQKPHAVAICQNKSAVMDSLVLCDWLYPMFISQVKADRLGDTAAESKLLAAVTGWQLSETELDRCGERIWNLERAIMVREGRTRKDDTLHESYFHKKKTPPKDLKTAITGNPYHFDKAVPGEHFEKAKDIYYQIRGWDPQSGRPRSQTLKELGLDDVAGELSAASGDSSRD